MKVKYVFILLFSTLFLLTGCASGYDHTKVIKEEIQIEMAKKFDVPISNVNIEAIEYDSWRFTIDKFLINIEGEEKTYLYIGNDIDGYELLLYEEMIK